MVDYGCLLSEYGYVSSWGPLKNGGVPFVSHQLTARAPSKHHIMVVVGKHFTFLLIVVEWEIPT